MNNMATEKAQIVVKLLHIAGQGPVLAVLQGETNDSLITMHPAQLGQDENGDIQILSYLGGLVAEDAPVVFMKSNIVAVCEVEPTLGKEYVSAVEALTKSSVGVIMPPEKKIIL